MNPSVFFARVCRVLAVTILSAVAAGGNAQPRDVPRFDSDGKLVYQAATDMKVQAGTTDAVLTKEYRVEFDAEGRQKRTLYWVYKIENQDGVEGWDNVEVGWQPWHENRPVIRARVITANGEIHELDPKTIADVSPDNQDDSEYSDRRSFRAPLPAVAAGSVVEEEYTWEETKPLFDAGVVQEFAFAATNVPIAHSRLILRAPAPLPIKYELQELNIEPLRTEAGGITELTFEKDGIAALDPGASYLPSNTPPYPAVYFSTGSSWKATADAYSKIVDDQIGKADVSAITTKTIEGRTSRDEKITAILQYVDREVRYTGVEFGDAAIMPAPPSETLKRKYGDCKDKSTLLVAMLRSAGIPAYVALLRAGQRHDVPKDLPGMGVFDHAIVYVPGAPDYWIDATDTEARLGELAGDDEGRLSLVARADTESLVKTPISKPEDNLQLELRTIYLADNGPARVVEVTEPHGEEEAFYRRNYRDTQNKDVRKQLSDYMNQEYLTEKVDRFEISGGEDITKPFTLTLESKVAKRGATDLATAVAAIRVGSLFDRLPPEFRKKPEKDEGGGEGGAGDPKKLRTDDWVLTHGYVTEWKYTIVPPTGFQVKALPDNQNISIGPMQLSEKFSTGKDGAVDADIRFDTVRREFSVAEENEIQKKIVDLSDGPATLIYFELKASALIRAGKPREAFREYEEEITEHPDAAMTRLRFAEALLDAGMGAKAREEARAAVKLAPDSALAEKELANVLEYDDIGQKFESGTDYAGAEAAFRAAMKLDPTDKSIPGNLAILLEFNTQAERYGTGARLKEAIATYQTLKPEELKDLSIANNLAFALFRAGEYAEARKYAEGLAPQPLTVIIGCEAALNGSQAAIQLALKRSDNEDARKELLKNAGTALAEVRLYAQAADLLVAGASGQNASNTMALAGLLRKATHHEDVKRTDTPLGVAMWFLLDIEDPQVSMAKLMPYASRNAKLTESLKNREELTVEENALKSARRALEDAGLPIDTMLDVILASMDAKVEGDDATGYRVSLRSLGNFRSVFFIVREGGEYKLLDSGSDPNAVGLEILDRTTGNDPKGAKVLLDWLRDEEHLAGGDDPLAGAVFPRIWTAGGPADAARMKLAAAAILTASRPTAREGLDVLESLMGSLGDAKDKLNCELALLAGYRFTGDYAKVLPIVSQLKQSYPDSLALFLDEHLALQGLGRLSDAEQIAEERLKNKPGDIDAYKALISDASVRGDFVHAHDIAVSALASEKSGPNDVNQAAWLTLFTGKVTDGDIDMVTKAAQGSSGASFGILHTLACLYAVAGKTKEAREIAIQAMNVVKLDEPEDNCWYTFGVIAEQYGMDDVAREDYLKLKKPSNPLDIPGSSYQLAQMRLKALGEKPTN